MQKTNKNYKATDNPVVVAMKQAPSENVKAFKSEFRNKKGVLTGAKYELFRRRMLPTLIMSKCDGGFINLCIKHINMDVTQFAIDPILQETTPFLSKIGLKKR